MSVNQIKNEKDNNDNHLFDNQIPDNFDNNNDGIDMINFED